MDAQLATGTGRGAGKNLFRVAPEKAAIHIFEGDIVEGEIPSRVAAKVFWVSVNNITQSPHLPLPMKTWKARLAGEELLHGSQFEVALLGDESLQPAQQPIHIIQYVSYSA